MSSKGEFGEPWADSTGNYSLINGRMALNTVNGAQELKHRAVACVNALAGRDPALVERQLEQRDELLAVAKALVDDERANRNVGVAGICDDCFVAAKAAIAKAEGGPADASPPTFSEGARYDQWVQRYAQGE